MIRSRPLAVLTLLSACGGHWKELHEQTLAGYELLVYQVCEESGPLIAPKDCTAHLIRLRGLEEATRTAYLERWRSMLQIWKSVKPYAVQVAKELWARLPIALPWPVGWG